MESKNLNGLFNLVRKEGKDVRNEIRALIDSLASLSVAINDLRGGIGQNLETREFAGTGKTEQEDISHEERGVENLGDQKSTTLLRTFSESSGDGDAVHEYEDLLRVRTDDLDEEEEEDSPDRKTFTPESGGTSVTPTDGQHVALEESTRPPDSLPTSAQQSQSIQQTQTQSISQESSKTLPISTETSHLYNPRVDHRLDAMSLQIHGLMEGQKEIMAFLKGLAERNTAGSQRQSTLVVFAPPRKVGRKIVGFVYEDDDDSLRACNVRMY